MLLRQVGSVRDEFTRRGGECKQHKVLGGGVVCSSSVPLDGVHGNSVTFSRRHAANTAAAAASKRSLGDPRVDDVNHALDLVRVENCKEQNVTVARLDREIGFAKVGREGVVSAAAVRAATRTSRQLGLDRHSVVVHAHLEQGAGGVSGGGNGLTPCSSSSSSSSS